METIEITADILGTVLLLFVTHVAMNILIKAELKVNPNPTDGFLFRWRASRWPILLMIACLIFIYAVYFRGYHLLANSSANIDGTLFMISKKTLIVSGITFPVIVFNLLNYKKIN